MDGNYAAVIWRKKMTATNELINDRVKVALAIKSAGLLLKDECDADINFASDVLQSQYVAFKVLCEGELAYETLVVRIADHAVAKPSTECVLDSAAFNNVDEIIKAINKIAANAEQANAVYENDGNDIIALKKWALTA